MIVLPSRSHRAISALPSPECSGSENQKCCSINLCALKARCWYMVECMSVWYRRHPERWHHLPTLPSCDVVWWPGATPTILSVLSFFRHNPGDICCPDTFDDTRTRVMTRGHVSRHPPSSAAVGEYSDKYNSYRV